MAPHMIITDIDGTLAYDHQHVSAKTQAVLQTLMAAGHLFYAATGRMYNLAKPVVAQVSPQAEIIAANGAVYEQAGRRVRHLLGKKALQAAQQAADAHALTAVFFSDQTMYYTKDQSALVQATLHEFAEMAKAVTVKQVHTQEKLLAHADTIVNGLLVSLNDQQALAQVHKKLAAQDVLALSSSDPTNIELIPKAVDKKTAVAAVQAYTGIPKARTIVFGDGLNDLGMMAQAAVSVAMGNALPAVKRVARHVTKANTEDGIAHFLQRYFGLV